MENEPIWETMKDRNKGRPRSSNTSRQAKPILLFVLIAIWLPGLTACVPWFSPEPTPVVISHTAEQLTDLKHLWTKEKVSIFEHDESLDASAGYGCFVGKFEKLVGNNKIVCFDDSTGEAAWQMEESATGGMLAITPTGVIVANFGVRSNLSKYGLQTGKLLWRNRKKLFEAYNPLHMTIYDSQVQMVTTKPDRLVIVDIEANTVREIENSLWAEAFLVTKDITFIKDSGIEARKTGTNELLWKYEDSGLASYPMATQDKLFCRSNRYSGSAYALDRNTGAILWQVKEIVYGSSLTYSPNKQKVYALSNNGDLLAINENTGTVEIAAHFSPPLI